MTGLLNAAAVARRHLRFPWLWWWELPGEHWWFPYRFLGREVHWDINGRGPVAWPGIIRCLFRPHADDSYGNCCYCGANLKRHP